MISVISDSGLLFLATL